MSYVTAFGCRATDVASFAAEANGYGKEAAIAAGATDVRVSQVVMGGERAGQINVAFECPTITAAMEVSAAMNSDAQVLDVLAKCGVQLLSRSLIRVTAERGTTEGAYSTGVMFSSNPVDDATADSNLGDAWEHIQAGANGMRMGQAYSAGVAMAPYFLLTWTDDLDALAAASANSFGDPKVQANMANSNTAMIGRMTSRTLG